MTKKITCLVAAGVAGMTIYLISQIIREKIRETGKNNIIPTQPRGTQSFEYTL